MKKPLLIITVLIILFFASSCSRKTTRGSGNESSKSKTAVAGTTKTVSAKKIKTPVPKVIVVNDSVASKTFDGRYYYDLEGHRYWRNNKDGKYYLYNKSMAGNPDFQKP